MSPVNLFIPFDFVDESLNNGHLLFLIASKLFKLPDFFLLESFAFDIDVSLKFSQDRSLTFITACK